ncbi:MAG: DNA polymerase I [Acidimicrobiia bacterium]|nr:DNA polymerase I [Acidimicrobiia bacterium]
MKELALLDGHSLAYRAFYALPPDLATPSGQVTNAVFGFTSMLIKLLDEESPDAIAVAWDRKEKTFRSERYPDYKATRETAPDIFRSQVPLIKEVLDALKIPQVSVAGYEADDVIATLTKRGREYGYAVMVVTGDRDAFQLSSDDTTVLYTRRGISDTVQATPAWIEERYGIDAGRYVEYAALRGDTSDNLPGVPGVGEKTAARLINAYPSLEDLYEHLDDQSPKLRENLANARDQVFLNRELMTMIDDVPMDDLNPTDLDLEPFDRDVVRTLFDDLAFRTLWQRLEELGGVTVSERLVAEVDVVTATSVEAARSLASDAALAIDPVWEGSDLAGFVVAGAKTTYVPLDMSEGLLTILADDIDQSPDPGIGPGATAGIVGHDVKPFLVALIEAELPLPRPVFDTMLAAHVINPAQRAPSLEDLAYRELGVAVTEVGLSNGSGAQGAFSFDEASLDVETPARRASAIAELVDPLTAQMDARGGLDLYRDVELPLVAILAHMEAAGVGLDVGFLTAFGEDLAERIGILEGEIHELAGSSFNVNSTLQLRKILFERLGLPVIKKTPKGAPSTDATVLEKLADQHEIVSKLLEFRELDKLRSTYVESLLKLVDEDGRIRGRFNQMGAATGRLSMEQPNLQNIPARSEEGRAIRKAFVAAPGSVFLVADYSQIELRILAHLSEDPGLVEAFANDVDIHAATAARVNGIDLSEVTEEMRRTSKMINFGLLYGMEAYGLGQRLNIDRDEAQHHIDEYFVQFPDVKAFMSGIVDAARESGYTTTILGRRRYLPELNSRSARDRQMGERMALNAPIQGSAADVIKKAMIDLDRELRASGSAAEMLLQIHDELVLEVPSDEIKAVTELTVTTMEHVTELKVPLKVSFGVGDTLADATH